MPRYTDEAKALLPDHSFSLGKSPAFCEPLLLRAWVILSPVHPDDTISAKDMQITPCSLDSRPPPPPCIPDSSLPKMKGLDKGEVSLSLLPKLAGKQFETNGHLFAASLPPSLSWF